MLGPVETPPAHRLLAFARALQQTRTFEELLAVTRDAIAATLGYQHVWLFVADSEDAEEIRLIDISGTVRDRGREVASTLRIADDPMLEEVVRGDRPVVVDDARVDPRTNKEMVALLGNRTIINVPLRLLDKPFGALGTGTFGDEGCRPPTPGQLDHLVGMASQLVVAVGRIRFVEERERAAEALSRTQEQLRHAQKMEAVGRLAGGVAHDFNNLLSVILSYARLLLAESEPPPSWRHDLTEIAKAGERAAQLTGELLAFSRHQMVVFEAVDLNAVVQGMENMIRRLIGEHIVLTAVTRRPLAKITSDAGLVEQALLNLVINARDAMPDGGRLLVETENVTLDEDYAREHVGVIPGPHVMLAVSDTGCGMDRETQARIFEPFFTTKERGKGTGLGLSTAYGLVQRSRGSIWVYSEPGNGTTLKLFFPATDAAVEPLPEILVVSPPRGGSETILLVEDEVPLRQVVREILQRHGYCVLEAEDPEDALRLGRSHPGVIHLLLTDVVMPQMNGRELAEQFRTLRPSTAILFVSGYTEESIIQHRGLARGLALLSKPITPDMLLQRVRAMLGEPGAPMGPEG